MGSGRSSFLRIGSNPAEESSSGRTNEGMIIWLWRFNGLPRGEPPLPLDKGKGKLNEIRFPRSSEYLRVAIQNAEVMGPS